MAILFQYGNRARKDRGVYVYDPAAGKWAAEPAAFPPQWGKGNRYTRNAFYDPELNVHFIHEAHDSGENGWVWAYRYREGGRQR